MSDIAALSAVELEQRLEQLLAPILSTRCTTAEPALGLARFSRPDQEFVLHWVGVIVKTNSEMGYQFAAKCPYALQVMDYDEIVAWLIHAMDIYDKQGLYPACAFLQGVERYAEQLKLSNASESLEDNVGVLQRFVRGLAGRGLRIEAGEKVYTDTECLFLPRVMNLFATKEENFQLYKATASFLWAQTWYGSFRSVNGEPLSVICKAYEDPEKALAIFHALETIRINARITMELSGLARQMETLQTGLEPVIYPVNWMVEVQRLQQPSAGVKDSYQVLKRLYPITAQPPARFCYQGDLCPEQTESAMQVRQQQEKISLKNRLVHLAQGMADDPNPDAATTRFSMETDEADDTFTNFELKLNDQTVAAPDNVQNLLRSIVQDFGSVPEDYLLPAGDGGYATATAEMLAEDVWMGTYPEEGAYLYNEWDCRRQHYRKDWCVLRELDVHPQNDAFVSNTLERYHALVGGLRKTFEALRGEDRVVKKQRNGEDLDLNAIVESITDGFAGLEMSDRVFTKRRKNVRDLAVIFMVDMSGSTKGWINDAEREALVLLCEALEVLGDRYAIYGFSGMTRKRCELFRVKKMDEPYAEAVKSRISGIKPQDYTRMGVTIRHLIHIFRGIDARTKLLVTLSDGKPDDYDGYRGEYGIEDTRQALIEAKHEGIHPFCITIDDQARDYLPRMYGAVNYVLIDEVRQLPTKISDIYRRLTT